jgi:AcrR family transcriptional regulator
MSGKKALLAGAATTGKLNYRKPREERWQELLDVAAQVFHEKGYDAATLQEIADRVGILKGSIYYYIKTKADLRDNLLLEVHESGIARMRRLAESDGPVLLRLHAMIHEHVEYMCRNMARVFIYLQEARKLSTAERKKLFGKTTYRDIFVDVVRKGQEEGAIRPDIDPKLAAQAMLGFLNSLHQWYDPAGPAADRAVADYFSDTLLLGHATEEGLKTLKSIK